MARKSKAQLYDLLDRIIHLYEEENMNLLQIESLLREEGYDISRESIRRSIKTSKQLAIELRRTREETVELVRAFEGMPAAETGEVMVDFLTTKIFESIKSIDELNFDDPQKLISAVASLNNSKINIAKLRLSFESGVEKAKSKILQELSKNLISDAQLFEQLSKIISETEVKA